MIYA
jgi:transposase-like protein